MKKVFKIISTLLILLFPTLLSSFGYHQYCLNKEADLRTPLGQMVEVDGKQLSVYVAGQGDRTLVFLSGAATSSPVLDFRTLSKQLELDYRIVIIERLGYGFSQVTDDEASLSSLLGNSRAALQAVGVTEPVVLIPHSMSGLEALYWAQNYPDEVEAIIGLDMSTPASYEQLSINLPLIKLGHYGAALGLTRLIPGLSENAAIKHGQLTEEEKAIYRVVFYNRILSKNMVAEAEAVKDNARLVSQNQFPNIPYLLFASNGEGTGFEEGEWRQLQKDFAEQLDQAPLIELDAPHYLHNYQSERIASEVKDFLSQLD